MLNAGDVIILFDGTTRDPKPRMMVLVGLADGYFYRIVSESHWRPNIRIEQSDHPFLSKKVSHIQCDYPLEFDEGEIQDAMENKGVVGQLTTDAMNELIQRVAQNETLPPVVRDKVVGSLQAALDGRG